MHLGRILHLLCLFYRVLSLSLSFRFHFIWILYCRGQGVKAGIDKARADNTITEEQQTALQAEVGVCVDCLSVYVGLVVYLWVACLFFVGDFCRL